MSSNNIIEVFDGKSILIHNNESFGDAKVLEGLVQKHSIERPGYSANTKSQNWTLLAKEYFALTGQKLTAEALKEKWKDLKIHKQKQAEDMKKLESSIATALKKQKFEVNQGHETKTTIVVVDEDNQIIETTKEPSKDLISLAIDESGLEQNWQSPSTSLPANSTLDETNEYLIVDYVTEAEEILKADQDPILAKKRLKWESKLRAEDNSFEKKRLEIEKTIETHKRMHEQSQPEILQLQLELKTKRRKLEEIQKKIEEFKS